MFLLVSAVINAYHQIRAQQQAVANTVSTKRHRCWHPAPPSLHVASQSHKHETHMLNCDKNVKGFGPVVSPSVTRQCVCECI